MNREKEKIALEAYHHGLYDPQIAELVGVTSKTIGRWRKIRGLPVNYDGKANKANICFDCRRGILDCQWMHKDIPIDGWTAERVPYLGGKKEDWTWHITKCPKFEE